jgi:RNA polymerase sigma factor (sigma-70 family)
MISLRHFLVSAKNRSIADPMQFVDDVYRYALARTGNKEDAEDIAIEVAQQAPGELTAGDLKPYMVGMARRKVADYFRDPSRRVETGSLPVGSLSSSLDSMMDVQRALDSVSESHRDCLILKYVNGRTSDEIGKLMDISGSAVDSLLQRARKAFANQWEIMHGDEDER